MKPLEAINKAKEFLKQNKVKSIYKKNLNIDDSKVLHNNVLLVPITKEWYPKEEREIILYESQEKVSASNAAFFLCVAIGDKVSKVNVGNVCLPVKAALDIFVHSDTLFVCTEEDILVKWDSIEEASK